MIRRARLNQGTWELLVQWKGFAASNASWMLLPLIREKYPDFQLEDELFLQKGRNVVDSFVYKTYQQWQ